MRSQPGGSPGPGRGVPGVRGAGPLLGGGILDDREAARQFILEFDWPYPSVFDPNGEIRDRLGYIGQPVTIVYDRDRQKSFEWIGALNAEILRREIRKVL